MQSLLACILETVDWDDPDVVAQLGSAPDSVVAKRLGTSQSRVNVQRNRRGIAAFAPKGQPAPDSDPSEPMVHISMAISRADNDKLEKFMRARGLKRSQAMRQLLAAGLRSIG